MGSKAMDEKISFTMFLDSMKNRFRSLLVSNMTDEEKLAQIIKVMTAEVQEKKELARTIGADMRAIADPDTKELEPLEACRARRVKLVALGGTLVDDPSKTAQLGSITQEIKGLEARISAQQATYDVNAESYAVAKKNYQEALAALENTRMNGPAILKAIRAHKDALAMRDKAKNQEAVDTKFMSELENELSGIKAAIRTDKEIDADLDATNTFNIDAELTKMDAKPVDEALMAEFKAAAEKKA